MTPAGSFFPHPEGMSDEAAELWRYIVDAHPRGYFQAGDVPLLRAYCEEYARRNRAERMLAEQGEVIETASGAVKRNPWHEVLVNSNSSLSQLATKLRLCVNSRISARDGTRVRRPAVRYVNSRISARDAGKTGEQPKPKRAGLMFGA